MAERSNAVSEDVETLDSSYFHSAKQWSGRVRGGIRGGIDGFVRSFPFERWRRKTETIKMKSRIVGPVLIFHE